MKGVLTFLAAAVLVSAGAHGDDSPMDRLIGDWLSPDGTVRQRIESHFNGAWLSTQMWFQVEGEWLVVGRGAMYPGPEHGIWVSATRTTHMGGIELFQSTVEPGTETFTLRNRAYMAAGTVLETREEWRFPDPDHINYVIYELGETEPWMTGSWVRRATGN